ncbi:MAG: hypothetical protein A1D16_05080 [Flavihumibacter sp. CACIAM 22H1]|nr:MAG: hypothetical protein A1D16_05080 [Flavihumibacter sp. CACIAM 22H1]
MIKEILFGAMLVLGSSTYAQKQTVNWGDEFKLKKGTSDINVLFTDETGVYIEEEHMTLGTYFVVGATFRESASLVKLNPKLQEIYRSDFNRELKGKNFEYFLPFQKKLFVVASDYSKADRAFQLLVGEVDKQSGEMKGSWKTIASIPKEEKKDQVNFRLFPNTDSSRLVLISTIAGREKNTYRVEEFDQNLRSSSSSATISNEFEPRTYTLEDVLYTKDKKIILVGRVFEYQSGKKKKEKYLDFSRYNIRIYDEKGKQQTELNTEINGKWVSSTKLMMGKDNDLLLASFYSKEKRGTTNGLLVQRIDPATGKVLSAAEKEINYSMVTAESGDSGLEEDDREARAERKERERLAKLQNEGEGFSKYMKFRNIYYTPDNGLVLLAENYNHYTYTSSSYSSGMNQSAGRWTYTTYMVYECGELVMCKLNSGNEIEWLQILPKSQREVITASRSSPTAGGVSFSSFFLPDGRPYYAGFGSLQFNDNIYLYFNDHRKNATVLNAGQKVSRIDFYAKSDCYVVTMDVLTGKLNRKVMFANDDQPTAMPRKSSIVGKELYLIGKTDRIFGKTKLAVGKVTTK